jgi:hypothetical protein
MPYDSLRHAVTPGCPSSTNAAKDPSGHDSRRHEPVVKGFLNPVWNRNSPNMEALPNKVNNRPVVFPPLEKVKSQFGEFPTTEPAAQQNVEKRFIALTFEGLASWRLPETASLLGRQPIPKPDTQFLCPLHATYACGKFGAQQPGVGSLISKSAHCGKSHVNTPRRDVTHGDY